MPFAFNFELTASRRPAKTSVIHLPTSPNFPSSLNPLYSLLSPLIIQEMEHLRFLGGRFIPNECSGLATPISSLPSFLNTLQYSIHPLSLLY